MATILLLDDDAPIRATARHLLEAEGFAILDTADPEVALTHLRRRDVDLAIVDLDLARRAGLDLAEAVCATAELDRVALIGVTFEDLARVDLSILDHAIQKPYAAVDLPEIVQRVLASSR